MISLPAAKWIMLMVLTTPCGSYSCADGITIEKVPFETRELCLTGANFASKKFREMHGRRLQVKAVCIQARKE